MQERNIIPYLNMEKVLLLPYFYLYDSESEHQHDIQYLLSQQNNILFKNTT